MVLLAPTVITIRSEVFQPLLHISSSKGAYFLVFSIIFSWKNLLLVYVISMNYIIICGASCIDGSSR